MKLYYTLEYSLIFCDSGFDSGDEQSILSDKYTDIGYGIKLSCGNIEFEGNILTLPHFSTFFRKSKVINRGICV